MKNDKSVSFIIPAYNCAETISKAIESIYDDNFSLGDEVIIVNDNSTDKTDVVIRKFINKYPNIKILEHKVNKGTAAASRNTGIENAANELIFCLDHDNILAKNSIPRLVEYLINRGADTAAFGELWYFSENINKITHKWVFRDLIQLADALAGSYWPGPSGNYLFTRSSWKKAGRYFEPSLENQVLDSWIFGIRQLGTRQKMVTLPGTGYFHKYGHQSHYVRNSKKGSKSLSALIGIIPFLDQIEETDLDYIFSKKGRFTWYENLSTHPIRIKKQNPGISGERVISFNENQKKNNLLIRAIKKIRRYLKTHS